MKIIEIFIDLAVALTVGIIVMPFLSKFSLLAWMGDENTRFMFGALAGILVAEFYPPGKHQGEN